MLAHLHARFGHLHRGEASRSIDLARDDFAGLPFDQEWLYGMSLLAETAGSWATRAPRCLLPVAPSLGRVQRRGSRRGVQGLGLPLPRHPRDDDAGWAEAELHYEDALALNTRMGARPWLAHTQHDYARMLLARNGHGDRERTQELLDDARMTYRELGMDSYAASSAAITHEADTGT